MMGIVSFFFERLEVCKKGKKEINNDRTRDDYVMGQGTGQERVRHEYTTERLDESRIRSR